MDKSKEKMKWILFLVFIILFTLAVLGTLGVVFLGFGTPTEAEREWIVRGLILEVAACVVALFYSIFGLKKSDVKLDRSFVSDLETRIEELEAKVLLSAKEIDRQKSISLEKCDFSAQSSGSSFLHEVYPYIVTIEGITAPPAFDKKIYNTHPSYADILADIENAKPFDKKHHYCPK